VDIQNGPDADRRKRQIDMEDDDRRTLAAAPWYMSFPAQLIAGTLDLPTLIPGGEFVRGATGGITIARNAARTALAAGGATACRSLGSARRRKHGR
jgi:hypothetical protein